MNDEERLTDYAGRYIGCIRKTGSSTWTAYDRYGTYVGSYDGRRTTDRYGRYVGEGNLLAALIH